MAKKIPIMVGQIVRPLLAQARPGACSSCSAPPRGLASVSSFAGRLDDTTAGMVLHNAADSVLLACPEGNILSWNEGSEHIFGWAADEAVGQPLALIMPERLRPKHDEGYSAVMTGSKQARYGPRDPVRFPAVRKDGGKIVVEGTLQVLVDGAGTPTGCLAMLRDITAPNLVLRKLRERIAELEKNLRVPPESAPSGAPRMPRPF